MIEGSRLRLTILGVIVMMLFSALLARLWFLQVAEGSGFAAAATSNRVRVVYEPGLRGQLLDRNGHPLVENKPADVVMLDRHAKITVAKRELVLGRLSEQLKIPVEEIKKRVNDRRLSPYAPVQIAVDVSPQTRTYIEEHHDDFPGIEVKRIALRHYPNGLLAAHLLGYVSEINEQELKTHAGQGYRKGDLIGKDGVEQMFESVLRGTPRRLKLEVDSQGRVVRTIEDRKAVPGKDVQLTLDLGVQRVAEESLAQGMDRAHGFGDTTGRFKATGGAVVVLDPNDGSVVAMASAPSYDPNQFINGIPPQDFKDLSNPGRNFPLINRAVQGQYAAGSTFKLITAVAAMQQNLLNPSAGYYDKGYVDVGSPPTRFYNAGRKAHGTVSLPSALTVSSDAYFYELGRDLWQYYAKWKTSHDEADLQKGYAIQNTAKEFGFGKITGIGLSGEAAGRIPDQAWKEAFNRDQPDPKTRRENSLWLPGDNVNLAVGQGDLLVTPLQLVTAYATFANGGTHFTPRVAKAVLEPGTGLDTPQKPVRELPAQRQGKTDLRPDVRDTIMSGLVGAVTNGEGTAHAAFRGFRDGAVAGKTGTAEGKGRQDTSLFVGITPVDQPQYVVASVVEQAGFGSAVSAPIVRRVVEALDGNLNPASVTVQPPNIKD